jgi:hypothetical protein
VLLLIKKRIEEEYMLLQTSTRSWLPRQMALNIGRSGVNNANPYRLVLLATPAATARPKPLTPPPIAPTKDLPTQFISVEQVLEKDAGNGHPIFSQKKKRNVWQRRCPWFTRQYSLDLAREVPGATTPAFPDGVEFDKIRKFQQFAGRAWKVNGGRRKKIKTSRVVKG